MLAWSDQLGSTTKDIKNIRFAVPPLELLQHFADMVEPLRKHIEFNLQESNTLADLRDALLPKLISGEVRVPDWKHGRGTERGECNGVE